MNREDKIKQQQEAEAYLQSKHVYPLLEQLLKSLIINKPKDPLDYLIAKLQEPEQKRIFVVGPPGFKVHELAAAIAKQHNLQPLVATEPIGKSSQGFQLAGDDLVLKAVKPELEKLAGSKKSYIMQGLPKTVAQAQFLRSSHYFPTVLLFVNLSEEASLRFCLQKLKTHDNYKALAQKDRLELAHLYVQQHNINIEKVKAIYGAGTYYEVDATKFESATAPGLMEQIKRILKFEHTKRSPKRPSKIVVAGSPCSGRTTLGHQLSQKYGLVYVSTADLIAHQINQNTPDGQKMREAFLKGDLVDEGILIKLLRQRLHEKDCVLQGFLLDGYPKTVKQLEYLKDFQITPNLFILTTVNSTTAAERMKQNAGSRSSNTDLAKRTKRWEDFYAHVKTHYKGPSYQIETTKPIKSVFEDVCFQLQHI